MSIDSVIAEVAAPQYGLAELGQLDAVGVRRHHIVSRLRSGHLERFRPGVFVVAGSPRSYEQAVLAAVLAAGSHAVASHATAAILWELPFVEALAVELTTPRPHWARMPGVRAHRTVAFLRCEHTVHRRIPVTSVARTLVDLAYPELKLAIEIDGWEHHRTRSAFDDDRVRANDLVVAGWNVLRFTSTMTDAHAVEIVGAALSQKQSA